MFRCTYILEGIFLQQGGERFETHTLASPLFVYTMSGSIQIYKKRCALLDIQVTKLQKAHAQSQIWKLKHYD